MKRLTTLAILLASIGLFSACNKDNGNLGEGLFQPKHKIEKITKGSTPAQTWSWGTSKLASINDTENGVDYSFAYSGDLLSNVTLTYTDGTTPQNIYYTYQGSLLSGIEIVQGTHTLATMQVMHNADDHISSINIDLSDYYLVQLAKEMMGLGKKSSQALRQVISPSAADAIVAMSDLMVRSHKSNAKYTISNKHFDLTYNWVEDNITRETLSGNVGATATIADVADAFDFGAYSSIITSMLGDQEWPLDCTVSSVTNYSYDNRTNPYQYCWNDGVSPKNLSANNILNSTTEGSADGTITLVLPESIPIIGGMTYPYIQKNDLGASHAYTYSYNKKKVPSTITIDGTSYDVSYTN